MAVLMQVPFAAFYDDDGNPLSGGKIHTYQAGTNTPKATYTDNTGTIEASNPIELDDAGRATVWIEGAYKIVVEDADGNVIRTTDNVISFTTLAAAANAYFQSFSGNGTQTAFTLSEDLGTDENAIMVFVSTPAFAQRFSGTGSTTVYNLSANKGTDPKALQVEVTGVPLLAATDYNLSGSTLTFTVAPANASNNIVVTQPSAAPFSILNPNQYTLNGTTLTFASAPVAGTNNIMVFAPSTLVGAASAAAAAAAISEANAATSAVLAQDWAIKTSGSVLADYSSKAYAIGGTGIDNVIGSSKDWATKATSPDGTTDQSAKTYASSALTYANTATTQAGIATTQAGIATTQAGNAATSATQAANAVIAVANQWAFASSTTMADPGTGNLRLNNASTSLTTNIAISALSNDSGNPNLNAFINTWDNPTSNPRGIVRVEKNATNFAIYGISGNSTDNTTWLQLQVSYIAGQGSFSASDSLFISYAASGNDGTGTGNVSSAGSPTVGSLTRWASSTTIENANLTGDVTTSGSGSTLIANNAVTTAKILDGNVTAAKLANTAVTPGSYTNANITVDQQGRLTAASNGISSAVNIQTFTGSGTWTKPSSGTIALIRVWGGGGSGGRIGSNSGGGGGGGGYSEKWVPLSSLGATETVTIGAGGVGVSSGQNGNPGGTTSFGSVLSAPGGGAGGDGAAGGGGGSVTAGASGASGGAGGQAGGGAGGPGGGTSQPGTSGLSFGGGGGGGGGGTNGAVGGYADFGGGGGGGGGGTAGGAGGSSANGGAGGAGAANATASNGVAPGGGGGACRSGTSGSGAAGRCEVYVF